MRTASYDAGSEREKRAGPFIPGPCRNNPFVRDPEGALIDHQEGITGIGDLDSAVDGWTGPAARITIERVSWSSATAHRTSRSLDAASHHLLPCEFMARHRYSGATSRLSVTAPSWTSGRSEAGPSGGCSVPGWRDDEPQSAEFTDVMAQDLVLALVCVVVQRVPAVGDLR
jgi:hypothetical protein